MTKTFEAIYQDGVIKPLEKLDLPENERLKVTIEPLLARQKGAGSLYGAFPELGGITEEDLKKAKQIWEKGLAKQRKKPASWWNTSRKQ